MSRHYFANPPERSLWNIVSTTGLEVARIIRPTLRGDTGRINIYLQSKALRDFLYVHFQKLSKQCITFEQTALLVRQETWRKYEFTNQDTDISAAYKILSNFLLKIHRAHKPGRNALRYLDLPFQELIQIVQMQDALKMILGEEGWEMLYKHFNSVWPEFSGVWQAVVGQPEIKADEIQEDYFAAPLGKSPSLLTLSRKPKNYGLVGQLTDLSRTMSKLFPAKEVKDFANLVDSIQGFFNSRNVLSKASSLISVLMQLIEKVFVGEALFTLHFDKIKNQEPESPMAKLVRFLNDLWIYLDGLESRLGLPGLITDRLANQLKALKSTRLASLLPKEVPKAVLKLMPTANLGEYLEAHLDFHNGVYACANRLDAAKQRLAKISQEVKDLTPPDSLWKFNELCQKLCLKKIKETCDLVEFSAEELDEIRNYLVKFSLPDEKLAGEFVDIVQSIADVASPTQREMTLLWRITNHFGKISNQLRGLEVYRQNVQNFVERLSKGPAIRNEFFDKLRAGLNNAAAAVDRLYEKAADFKPGSGVADELLNLKEHLENLTKAYQALILGSGKGKGKGKELIDHFAAHYQQTLSSYTRLCDQAPLMVRQFLHQTFVGIRNQVHHLADYFPNMPSILNAKATVANAPEIKQTASLLTQVKDNIVNFLRKAEPIEEWETTTSFSEIAKGAVGFVAEVAADVVLGSIAPAPVDRPIDRREAFLNYLQKIQKNIAELMDALKQNIPLTSYHLSLVQDFAKNWFYAQRLGNLIKFSSHYELAIFWDDVQRSVNQLADEQPLFHQILDASEQAGLEDKPWRTALGIGDKLPALPQDGQESYLEVVHQQVVMIQDKIIGVINAQPKTSCWRQVLDDAFTDQDTLEMSYLRSFLTMLRELAMATEPNDFLLKTIGQLRKLPLVKYLAFAESIFEGITHPEVQAQLKGMLNIFKVLMNQVAGLSTNFKESVGDMAGKLYDSDAKLEEKFFPALLQSGFLASPFGLTLPVSLALQKLGSIKGIKLQEKIIMDKKAKGILIDELSRIDFFSPKENILVSIVKVPFRLVRNYLIRPVYNSVVTVINKPRMQREAERIEKLKLKADEYFLTQKTVQEIFQDNPAVDDMGRFLRGALIKLDEQCARYGLVEIKSAVNGLENLAESRVQALDPDQLILSGRWQMIKGQPFLLDRLINQLEKRKQLQEELKHTIPQAVVQLIKIIKNPEKFKGKAVEDLKKHRQEIESYLEIAQVDQHDAAKLIDAVINYKQGSWKDYINSKLNFSNPKFLSMDKMTKIADHLHTHVYKREREIKSAEFMLSNLNIMISENQKSIFKHYNESADTLVASAKQILANPEQPVEKLEKFAVDYLYLVEQFQKLQNYAPDLAKELKIILRIREVYGIMTKISYSSPNMLQAIKAGSQFELGVWQDAAEKLNEAIQALRPRVVSGPGLNHLQELQQILREVLEWEQFQPTLIDLIESRLFIGKCIQVRTEYPALSEPIAQFINLSDSLKAKLVQEEGRLTYDSLVRQGKNTHGFLTRPSAVPDSAALSSARLEQRG